MTTIATRLPTDMSGWMPTTRHYVVEGGHLAVIVANFFTATGTEVFYCEADGTSISTEAIARFPDGTSHDQALGQLGYTVVDEIGAEPEPEPEPEPESVEQVTAVEQSVLEILPPEIAQMIATSSTEQSPENTGPTGG